MIIDEKKLKRQNIGVDKWINNGSIGILNYATGVGKTYTSFLAIKRLLKNNKFNIVIILPSEHLKNQWIKEVNNNFYKKDIKLINFFTIQEILTKKYIIECDLCIVDEIHEFGSEKRVKSVVLKDLIKWKYFLALTASGKDKNLKKVLKYIKIIDVITEEEALDNNYISPFIEYNLGLDLTDYEKEQYNKYTDTISELLPIFNKNLKIAQNCLSGGRDKSGKYYEGINWAVSWANKKGWNANLDIRIPKDNEIDRLYNPYKIVKYARTLMASIRNRKSLLHLSSNKYPATLKLLKKFNNIKTIIFSEDTKFADRVYKLIIENKEKAVIYHSNLATVLKKSKKTGKLIKYGKTRLKKEAINSISEGIARVLVTAKSLDRGLDIKDLRFGIITSSTQNPTQQQQRRGRVIRKENIFSKTTVLLVNLYIKDTKDEIWLKKRQKLSNHNIIEISNIDEIDYIPPPIITN